MTQRLAATSTQEELERTVRATCEDPQVDGVLIQLPLPPHMDEDSMTNALDPWKDVDGVHPVNMGLGDIECEKCDARACMYRHMLMRGHCPRFVSCTALGCMHLMKLNGIEVENKTAVVVGDSNCVGIPLSVLLRNENAAIVSVCHGISYKECAS